MCVYNYSYNLWLFSANTGALFCGAWLSAFFGLGTLIFGRSALVLRLRVAWFPASFGAVRLNLEKV